jgi:PTH2 family peptidyl-tRNA hydrolase
MEHKMVILVRRDLRMSAGKVGAQACHAALKAERGQAGSQAVRTWRGCGEPIVLLKCSDEAAMAAHTMAAERAGLPVARIHDAGRTQVDAGAWTVTAIGPAAAASIDAITRDLSLF